MSSRRRCLAVWRDVKLKTRNNTDIKKTSSFRCLTWPFPSPFPLTLYYKFSFFCIPAVMLMRNVLISFITTVEMSCSDLEKWCDGVHPSPSLTHSLLSVLHLAFSYSAGGHAIANCCRRSSKHLLSRALFHLYNSCQSLFNKVVPKLFLSSPLVMI